MCTCVLCCTCWLLLKVLSLFPLSLIYIYKYIYEIYICVYVYVCIYIENLTVYLNNKSLNYFIYIFPYICINPLIYTSHQEVEGCLVVPHIRRLGSSRDLPIVSCRHAEAGLSVTQLPWSHRCSNNSVSSCDLIASPI